MGPDLGTPNLGAPLSCGPSLSEILDTGLRDAVMMTGYSSMCERDVYVRCSFKRYLLNELYLVKRNAWCSITFSAAGLHTYIHLTY